MKKILFAIVIVIIIVFAVIYKYYPQHIPFLKMPKQGYPGGVVEGQVVRDEKSGAIYKLVGGQKRWFPNPTIFAKYEPSQKYTNIDLAILNQIPNGPKFE